MHSRADLIGSLPKAELHIHLEGSLDPELLFAIAQRNGVTLQYDSVEALRAAYVFDNLQQFLDIYYVGMQVLRKPRDFHELALAYFRRAAEDGVRHIEAFFDPQAHIERQVSVDAVMEGLNAAILDAREFGVSVFLIPCFLRHLPADDALRTLELLKPYVGQFHAVGLDSSERGFPPVLFDDVFASARSLGLRCVAHAGEEGPPEYVWQALDILKVDRIDHGNRAMEDARLIHRLAQEGMPLTVCPLSNLKLGVISSLENHPIRDMLHAGIVATVNSDDPAYFGGYVNDNYRQVTDAVQLSDSNLVKLAKNSFAASFLDDDAKHRWIVEIEQVEQNLGAVSQTTQ